MNTLHERLAEEAQEYWASLGFSTSGPCLIAEARGFGFALFPNSHGNKALVCAPVAWTNWSIYQTHAQAHPENCWTILGVAAVGLDEQGLYVKGPADSFEDEYPLEVDDELPPGAKLHLV